jgi:hypothetical protein
MHPSTFPSRNLLVASRSRNHFDTTWAAIARPYHAAAKPDARDISSDACDCQPFVFKIHAQLPPAYFVPFTVPSAEPSTRFYRLLKTIISGRFLGRRRSGQPGG